MARRWRAPDAVALGALGLAIAAAAATAAGGAARAADADLARGLPGLPGLGRALDLSRCPGAFDPRAAGPCGLRHGPVPGLDAACPDHALPPLPEGP
jgi:hypothetical protein